MSALESLNDDEYGQLERLLIRNEQFKALPYDDGTGSLVKAPKGNLTWLIGCNLMSEGSLELAKLFLSFKLKQIEVKLKTYSESFGGLSAVRKIVIFDMAFNIGINGLMNFHSMWYAIDHQDWVRSAAAMQASGWYHQVGERAIRNQKMMLTNEWCSL